MRLPLLPVFSSFVGLVAATPNAQGVCGVEREVLSLLHEAPSASAFCSEFLSIKTCTITRTSTKTVAIGTTNVGQIATTGTTTVTVTATETTYASPTTITVTSATQPTTTTTTTATFALDISVTCLNSGTIFTPTQITPTVSVATILTPRAEHAAAAHLTPDCLKPLPSATISKACSCLSIPTPKTTSFVTVTARVGTATATLTNKVLATSTTTVTATPVTTVVVTVASPTTTVTSTVSTTAQASQPTLGGLNWYFYDEYYGNEPLFYTNGNPGYNYSGDLLGDVNFFQTYDYPSRSSACTLVDGTVVVGCSNAVVVYQGFLYATQGAGAYTFYSPAFSTETSHIIDDYLFIFSGGAAGGNWDPTTADLVAIRETQDGSFTYILEDGEFLALSIIWVNSGAVGEASLQITTPDNIIHTDTTGFFMPPCENSVLTP